MPSFAITEFFPGIGTLCSPFVEGLGRHGPVRIAGAVELDGRYLQLYSDRHPEASTALGSVLAFAPEETVFPSSGDETSIFLAGIPCTGASAAGRAKNRLEAPELHPEVGALFIPFLHHVTASVPDLIVAENVPLYAGTLSARLIRSHLSRLGYSIIERTINPFHEFATPTERVRWVMVASRKRKFDWRYDPRPFVGTIERFLDEESEADLGDAFTLDQVAAHTAYCDRKAREGCGFSRRVLERTATKVPTFCKSYGKVQPTSVFLRCGETYRMFRPREIARMHGFANSFVSEINRLPKTTAYEVLGQGVVAEPFRQLGCALGEWSSGDGR